MSTSEMKLCPYCGEEIRSVAIMCKHCHMMLDGSGRLAGAGQSSGGSAGGSAPGMGSSPGTGSSPGVGATGAGSGQPRFVAGTMVGAGRYELKRQLGAGGMGEVLLAEHTYTGQKVALKAVWPNLMASEGPRKRFLQEGRVLASLKHPNIVGLTDFFEEEGRFYLAMEYIEGKTLAARLDSPGRATGAGLPITEVVSILKGILAGLAHAHKQANPVVHRDVKPANIMLASDGRVVLMDFGIAKVAAGEKLTSTAGVVGTYEYMSPEQVMGQDITPATDVYAVGIVAFELLTGRVPFPQRSDSGYDAMEGHRVKPPPPITHYRPDCPSPLTQWVEKALAKSPAQRFRDASEMLRELDGLGQARPAAPVVVTAPAALPMAKSMEQRPATQADSASPDDWIEDGGRSRTWAGLLTGALRTWAGPLTGALVLLVLVALVAVVTVWPGGLGKKAEPNVAAEKKADPKPAEARPAGAKLTRTDTSSGLIWQVTPTGGRMNWSAAKAHCANLDLPGGGWRLPTIGELRTLIRGCPDTERGGSCNVADGSCLNWSCREESCSGCPGGGGDGPGDGGCYWPSGVQGECSWYWSSSPVGDVAYGAWLVYFYNGAVNNYHVDGNYHVRCVR